jgi:hypothetical protein
MKRLKTNGEAEAKVVPSLKKPKLKVLTIPTGAEIAEVVADFHLAKEPAAVLDFVIKDALADIRSFQNYRMRKVRQGDSLAEPIEEIYKPLTKLVSFLEANPGVLKEILPALAGERLGELFSFTGIGRALDGVAIPDDGELLGATSGKTRCRSTSPRPRHSMVRRAETMGCSTVTACFCMSSGLSLSPSKVGLQRKPPTRVDARPMLNDDT